MRNEAGGNSEVRNAFCIFSWKWLEVGSHNFAGARTHSNHGSCSCVVDLQTVRCHWNITFVATILGVTIFCTATFCSLALVGFFKHPSFALCISLSLPLFFYFVFFSVLLPLCLTLSLFRSAAKRNSAIAFRFLLWNEKRCFCFVILTMKYSFHVLWCKCNSQPAL